MEPQKARNPSTPGGMSALALGREVSPAPTDGVTSLRFSPNAADNLLLVTGWDCALRCDIPDRSFFEMDAPSRLLGRRATVL